MVKCWNCEHIIRIYSGKPRKGKLFENQFRKCIVKAIVLERYSYITVERECGDYNIKRGDFAGDITSSRRLNLMMKLLEQS